MIPLNKYLQHERERVPLYDNPHLVDGEQREVMVVCRCGAEYRLWVNGSGPTPAVTIKLGIKCRNCGRDISEANAISGHSADVFNATWVLR